MRKYLFLPHCLRNSKKCIASIHEEGYSCASCGACKIGLIVEAAAKAGVEVFVAPGGSLVKKIFESRKITDEDIVYGVACETELRELKENFIKSKFKKSRKIPVKLLKDGCINTDVDVEALILLMNRDIH